MTNTTITRLINAQTVPSDVLSDRLVGRRTAATPSLIADSYSRAERALRDAGIEFTVVSPVEAPLAA